MNLENLRKKIDETDAEIVHLMAQRVRIALAIGKLKKETGRQVEDLKREEVVLERVKNIARQEGLNETEIEDIYRQVINASRKVQRGSEVAFQGEAGAYSEEAALFFFGPRARPLPCESLEEVFKAVQEGQVPYGIVPVENSLEGSISRVYDLLLDSTVRVCGETELRIAHCLIAGPEVRLDLIKKVYSHPQALAQCQRFLRQLGCELVPTYDTAGSVLMLKEKGIKDGAAIASVRAAKIYGMKVMAREIEDNPQNYTRFLAISREDGSPTGKDKTSIVFSVKHRPGTLYRALRMLAARKVNLTKIESRPTKRKPWEYNFYVDFEGHRDDAVIKEALKKLEEASLFLKVLGSYPRAKPRMEK